MEFGQIVSVVMAGLFALAFAAWARRLDKALDLLEKIQEQMHKSALKIERRLSRLEVAAVRHGWHHPENIQEDDDDE